MSAGLKIINVVGADDIQQVKNEVIDENTDSGIIEIQDELSSEEAETLSVLKSLGAESLFHIFKEERIYKSQLTKMTSPLLLELMKPYCRVREISDFVYKLNQWKKNFSRKDACCGTQDTLPKYPLEPILNSMPTHHPMPHAGLHLTNTHRGWLCEGIAKYFLRKNMPFTQVIRDDIAMQIVKRYPHESRYYYSDDGLAHKGADQLYVTFRFKMNGINAIPTADYTKSYPAAQPLSSPVISAVTTKSSKFTASQARPSSRVAQPAMAPPDVVADRRALPDAAPKTRRLIFLRRATVSEERPNVVAKRPPADAPKVNILVANKRYVLNTQTSLPSDNQPPPAKIPKQIMNHQLNEKDLPKNTTSSKSSDDADVDGGNISDDTVDANERVATNEIPPSIEHIKNEFSRSLLSCLELNKNILSPQFETDLNIHNSFRDRVYCMNFVEKFMALLSKRITAGLGQDSSKLFSDLPLNNRLALSLFLVPAALTPNQGLVLSGGDLISTFISNSVSVQDFVSNLRQANSSVPHVAIIGKLKAPLSYVVYYAKKIYRFEQLWHAVDMAVKIYKVYKPQLPADTANAWQFIMIVFYGMNAEIPFVYPSVKALQKFLYL